MGRPTQSIRRVQCKTGVSNDCASGTNQGLITYRPCPGSVLFGCVQNTFPVNRETAVKGLPANTGYSLACLQTIR
jgi:hypothetical protein